MKKIILLSLFVSLSICGFSADFYWVGNGGSWSDFTNHWATTSNGTIMHTRVPDANDNVFFDQNSFSSNNQVVVVDTTFISCAQMSWNTVTNKAEFLSSASDTLIISNQLILSGTADMSFNFFGNIFFTQTLAGQVLSFDPADHLINAEIWVNINAGTLNVLNDLNMSSKRLVVIDGELNMNSNQLFVKHFNADVIFSNPIVVNNPSLSNVDTLVCFGSLHFVDELDINSFSGAIRFKSNLIDTNYVNIENHSLTSELIFSSGKKYFLLSDLVTDKNINFPMYGQFMSQGYNIFCNAFISEDPYNRTIDLSTSEIHAQEFFLETFGLTINSSNSDLIFEGVDNFSFYTNKSNLDFKTLTISSPNTIVWNGKIEADTVSIVAGAKFFLAEYSMITLLDLIANGDCGNYIELRAICDEDNLNIGECVSVLPIFKSVNPITSQYLKVSNVKADGTFNLTNSFDEGGNEGWMFSEPNTVSTLYWIGNTGNWNTSGSWSASSNGPAQTCIPTKATHVVFDQFSFGLNDTLRLNDYGYCASMTWRNLTNQVVFDGNGNLFITDSIALNSFIKLDFSGNISLQNSNATDTIPIITAGVIISAPISIDGAALWDFTDATILNSELTFNSGKLEFSGNSLLADKFISNTNNARQLNITNTTINLLGDGYVWDLSPTNLVFTSLGSNISVAGMSQTIKAFSGANQTYNNLNCLADFVKINGSNEFGILKIAPGNTVNFESASVCTIDSIDAIADCTNRVSLTSDLYDSPATLIKIGFDTLQLDNFYIKNIVADTTGAIYYEAANTIRSGNVEGWVFSDTIPGKTFHWIGQTKEWNNLANWEISGVPALCLPTINDTVIIDPIDFSAALTDTILIDKNAFCHSLFADAISSKYLHVEFAQNLSIFGALQLSDSVGLNYVVKPNFDNVNDYNYGVVIMPDSANCIITSQSQDFNVNLYLAPSNITDTVFLDSNLVMDSTSSIVFLSGQFDAQQNDIICGFFITESASDKSIDISGSNIDIAANLQIQDNSVLSFNADSSTISFSGNTKFFTSFEGGNQEFFDVVFNGTSNDSVNDLLVFVSGANTFNVFKALNGLNIFMEAGRTQTVDSAFIINGTCQNYVNLSSSEDGVRFVITSNNSVTDTVTCVVIKDCEIQTTGVAMLSENEGNNLGWTFNTTAAASPGFDLPYPACISTELTFNNTSVSMWGGTNNLVFEWTVENQDTTAAVDLLYTFDLQGDYAIKLKATDTITGCFDTYSEDLTINNHSVNISSCIPGLAFCEGSNVTFTATSDLATDFAFYLNNLWIDLGDPTINQFTTTTLQDEDSIKVVATYNGCQNTSNSLEMTVHPIPIVSLTCSDSDTTICDGETITFTASGADLYEFLVDGNSIGSFSANNIFTTNSLTDSQVVTVRGKSSTGCIGLSTNSYTVIVISNPTILLVSAIDPPEVCSGDLFSVNASGGDIFEFFINGVSQGVPTAQNTFESALLGDGNIITALGYNSYSCSSLSNSVEVTVNPMPETVLTSSEVDLEICTGESVVFTGSGATEYLFFIDNLPQGIYSTTESLNTNLLTHNQTISLVGRIGNCYDTASNEITISVFPVIDLISSTFEICPGENIDFTASGDTIYQFFIDGLPVGPADSNPIFSSNSLINGQIVTVEGTPGACLPSPISITVNPIPNIELACSDSDNTICLGDLLTFTASGAFEYEFFIDGVSQGGASQNSQLVTSSIISGQTITVSGYSEFGCFNTSPDSHTITVNEYPVVSLSSSVVGNQICEGDEIEFTASGADEFLFFVSGVAQGLFSASPILTTSEVVNGSTFSAQGSSNDCIATAPETFTITVFSLPNVSLTPLTPISACESELISVQATGASSYEFFVNAISQGTPSASNIFESVDFADNDQISVIGYQNICSLASPDTIIVDINQIPVVSFSSNIPLVGLCFGDTAEFNVSGALSYQFYLDGDEYGGITSENTILIPQLENNQIIEVRGYNNSCAAEDIQSIAANVNYVNLEISSDVDQYTLCSGQEVTITATGSDIYEFFIDGVSQAAPSNTHIIIISNIENGQFVSVEATDAENGCKTISSNYFFNVSDIPQIFVGSDAQFCQYDSVMLSTNSDYNLQWYYNSQIIEGANLDYYSAYSGGNYSVFSTSGYDMGVFSSGANSFGQLGNGNNFQSSNANRAILNNPIDNITTGEDFAIALDENGNLMAWGNNAWGNLGIGTYSPVYTPVQINGISNISEICAGYNHVVAIKSDSTLMSWGQNTYGQLGYGNSASSNFPMQVLGIDSVYAIAAGRGHSLALTSDGKVYAWGLNNYGQLGVGNLDNENAPVLVTTIDSIIFVAAGADYSFAIRYDGTLWAWGCNDNGQLGINSLNSTSIPTKVIGLKDITQVAGGVKHSIALNQRGEIFTWGSNSEGQLGLISTASSAAPVKLEHNGVKHINCGQYNTYVINNDGSLWSWGLNNFGQLGDLTTENKFEPTRSSQYFGIKQVSAGNEFVSVVWESAHTCASSEIELVMDSVPDVIITREQMTLSCTQGQSYQWYFNGSILNNTNSQTITISAEGEYSVEVFFNNGCSAWSDVYSFYLDIDDWFTESNVQISPNPNNGTFGLILNMPESVMNQIYSLSLVSVSGAIIKTNNNFDAINYQYLDFAGIEPGAYYLTLKSNYGSIILKVFITE